MKPPGNTRLVQVIRGHFHLYPVAGCDAHPTLAHLAADRRQNQMFIWQFHAKHRAGKHCCDDAFHFDMFFIFPIHFRLLPKSSLLHKRRSRQQTSRRGSKRQRPKEKERGPFFSEPRLESLFPISSDCGSRYTRAVVRDDRRRRVLHAVWPRSRSTGGHQARCH